MEKLQLNKCRILVFYTIHKGYFLKELIMLNINEILNFFMKNLEYMFYITKHNMFQQRQKLTFLPFQIIFNFFTIKSHIDLGQVQKLGIGC